MDAKKMSVAIAVSTIALLAAIAATAHSRRILKDEQNIFPPGVLSVGETATVGGCFVRVDDADVTDTVPSIDTRGSERLIADPDWRFVRLQLSVTNGSKKPVKLENIVGDLRFIRTDLHEPAEIEIIWLRGYEALPKVSLAPGEQRSGKLAVHVSEYALIYPFIVEIGGAQWGLDVIDHDAPVGSIM